MTPILWRLVILAIIGLGGVGIGWKLSEDHYEVKFNAERKTWSDAILEGQKAVTKAVTDNDALKTKLEIQHAQANDALNVLLSHPAPRVRLPACLSTAADSSSNSATGSAVPITATERASDRNQQILDDITERLKSKAVEWSKALNACSVVMGWGNAPIQ